MFDEIPMAWRIIGLAAVVIVVFVALAILSLRSMD
jgi:hypothetical protein